MSTTISPPPKLQFFDNNGHPLVGGKVFSFDAGTTIPASTYQDSTGTVANPNPVVLNSRGECSIWFGLTKIKLVLTDSVGTVIWSVDGLNGPDQATINAINATLTGSGGSASIGFIQTGAGAVLRNVQDKLREQMSVTDFGAVGDGVTDCTSFINLATDATIARNADLYFPPGTYICANIATRTGMRWVGASFETSIIKLKSGANTGLIVSPGGNSDGVSIENLRFEGNSVANAPADLLHIVGVDINMVNVYIHDSAGTGLHTDWDSGIGDTTVGPLGLFRAITIDSAKRHGWLHEGPPDVRGDQIHIIDAGNSAHNTYYGMYIQAGGRWSDVHPWMRDETMNAAIAGVYLSPTAYGNTFTLCHFESGVTSLMIDGAQLTTCADCLYYAPRGAYAIRLSGNQNRISGVAFGYGATSNPHFKAIRIDGSANVVDLIDAGCYNGTADFIGGAGNDIKLNGYRDHVAPTIVGTLDNSNYVRVNITGVGAYVYRQDPYIPWTPYTPVVSALSGSITAHTATGSWMLINNTILYEITIDVTNNGTGASHLYATLPRQSKTGSVGAGTNITTGKMVQATLVSAGTAADITTYDGTYPIASGQKIYISGMYEILT